MVDELDAIVEHRAAQHPLVYVVEKIIVPGRLSLIAGQEGAAARFSHEGAVVPNHLAS